MRHPRASIRSSRARFLRSVIESLAEGVIVADVTGRFVIANEAARSLVGAGDADVDPADWSQLFGLYLPGTDTLFPADELPLARAIRGEHVVDCEVLVRNRHRATATWLSVSGSPLRDRSGNLLGGVTVFRDVTARRAAEAEIRRLSTAVEQTADTVFITNRQGAIEYVNPAFETTTGYTKQEVLGQTPRVLKSGEQPAAYYAELWGTLLAGKPFKGSVINRRKNGELFHAEQTVTPIRDNDGTIRHFVSLLKDMTERRQLEEHRIEQRLASRIQQRLFPNAPPRIGGFDIAARTVSALSTCGDYFDYLDMQDGSLAVIVADACGHGAGPALIMAQTRAYLRLLVKYRPDLDGILHEINNLLAADLESNRFVTMLLASLDRRSASLRWASAGHPAGIVLDSRGAVRAEMKSTGVPLGLFIDRSYTVGGPIPLAPGELALLVSDGIAEAESPAGVEFGIAGALDVIRDNLDLSAQDIVDRVHEAIRTHCEGLPREDDVTIVVCKREATHAAPGASLPD